MLRLLMARFWTVLPLFCSWNGRYRVALSIQMLKCSLWLTMTWWWVWTGWLSTAQCRLIGHKNGWSFLMKAPSGRLPPGSVIQVTAVTKDSSTSVTPTQPAAITQLLQEFQSVFEPLQGFPPEHAFAHDIPLIPGAAPSTFAPIFTLLL